MSKTCDLCKLQITSSNPGEMLYDDQTLVMTKHKSCSPPPLKDALSELEDTVIIKRGGPVFHVMEKADPEEVKELRRRSEVLHRAMEMVINRIEASAGHFPWEAERRARIRLSVVVTCLSLVAFSALLVSAAALWRTL